MPPSHSPDIAPYTLSPHIADLVIRRTHPGSPFGVVDYRDPALRRTKVAICGAGGAKQMPWDDPTYECWALNNFWNMARDSRGRLAASRWWEQHQIFPDTHGPHKGHEIQNAEDMQWIRECPVPLYTTEPFPDNPRAVIWPADVYAAKYRDYFTCTFAYQIVQAYDEGFTELLVCGLELLMGTKREATVEHGCVTYWLGYVEGRGMKVTLAPCVNSRAAVGRLASTEQFLLKHPYRYGHDYWQEADFVKAFAARWDERKMAV